MPSWRKLLPETDFLGVADFPKPIEVTISRAAMAEMPSRDDKKSTEKEYSACLWILDKNGNEFHKKWKLPKLVMQVFSWMLGEDYALWAGQKITLKPTWCNAFGDIEPCIRPVIPADIQDRLMRSMKKKKTNRAMWECPPPRDLKPQPQPTQPENANG